MKIFKNYIISILTYCVSITLLIIISSCIFAYTNIEDRYIDTATYVCIGISSAISGFIAGKTIKKKGIIHGVVVNGICMCILLMTSCTINRKFSISNTFWIYLLTGTLSGIVGGILGVNVK